MRQITDHKLNGLNDALKINALDLPSPFGSNHIYEIDLVGGAPTSGGSTHVIHFQNGPIIGKAGVNGISNEALLAIIIDRLRGFQGEIPKPQVVTQGDAQIAADAMGRDLEWGKFRCRENALALTHLEEAMMWLQKRTRDRTARGVEGTLQR